MFTVHIHFISRFDFETKQKRTGDEKPFWSGEILIKLMTILAAILESLDRISS